MASPHFKDALVSQLTPEIAQGFVDSLLQRGLSVTTVQSVFTFLKNGVKNIKDSEGKSKTKIVCLTPKGDASRRDIPLPTFLAEMLKEYKKVCTTSL